MDKMVSVLPGSVLLDSDFTIGARCHNNMSKFDSDGRRRLSGLSQAIRKHAQQSTSPSSDAKYGGEQQFGQKQMKTKVAKTKTAPTIEDRLLSLLNSDTEVAESQTASNSTTVNFDKPPTYELGSKGYHGSYSPRLAESKMRVERLNRNVGIESQPVADINRNRIYQRTRSLSSENVLKDAPLKVNVSHVASSPPSSVCGSTSVDSANGNKLRRCVSAVPASFSDENWNVVPESPKATRDRSEHSPICPTTPPLTPSTLGRRTPTGAYNLAIWDQRPPPSPSRVMTLPPPNSSLPNSPKQPTSPIAWPCRSYGDSIHKSNEHFRKAVDYAPNSLPNTNNDKRTPGKFLVRVGSPAHIPIAQPSGKDVFRTASPVSPCSITQNRLSSPKQRPIQYVEPPLPASIRMTSTMPRSRDYPADELKISPLATMSHPTTPKSTPPVSIKRNSGKTEKSVLKPNDCDKIERKITSRENTESTQDDDPESCKSEDRDSGAILDAEPSVFDFDSSVLSESENETLHGTPSRTHKSNCVESTKERIWSRSSTPTLPPLSPYDSEAEISRVLSSALDRDATHDNKTTSHSPNEKNQVARLPSYDSLVRKKAEHLAKNQRNGHKIVKMESHDHELSPTESALAESCDKPGGITEMNDPAFMVLGKASSTRRISRRRNSRASSRASSCDERRGIVSGNHRIGKRGGKHKRRSKNAEQYTYYEIEESTRSKKTLERYPVFYRPGEDNVPSGLRDHEETSSVKSFTSASVTSSAIRKHGRRHHRRHHQHSGALEKAYAKEVRAANKRVTRLESHVVTLARSVAQLSSELRSQVEITHDVEDLRKQIDELRREKSLSRKSSMSSFTKSENQKKSILFKTQPKRVRKLTKFFGEKPPILSIFLTDMGYEKYVPNFNSESIGMAELPYMDEERLKSIGIPLGPRLRILNEAKKTCFV